MRSIAVLVAVALLVVGSRSPSQGADLPHLPMTESLELALDGATTVIVAPRGPDTEQICPRLADGLEHATGHRPAILAHMTDPEDLGPGPVIALGNLMDSRLVRRLYLRAYDFTDYSWPSPGGHVLRTIRDPLGTGADVVLLGGSDRSGIADAAGALVAHVRENGPVLDYLNEVEQGQWADEIKGYSERFLSDDDDVWTRVGGAGSWNYQIEITIAGVGYLRTGDERYLDAFRRELQTWFEGYVLTLREDAPPMTHGFLHKLLIVWDLVRDHPSFSAEERSRFDRQFLYVFQSSEGPRRILGQTKGHIIRNNHGTRTALDGLYGGRFFWLRFGLEEGREWMQIAGDYFDAQLGSAKPVEDSWGHQWNASLFNTLDYALATDHREYFSSDVLRHAAERAVIAHGQGAGPRNYLSACAIATGDTRLLSGYQGGPEYGRMCARMHGHGDEYMRAFCSDAPIGQSEHLLGVSVAPLDGLWYETIDDAGFNPGGLFEVTVDREDGFDVLSMREGWEPHDFYLLLDGISGGHHSYQNASCVVTLREAGVNWTRIHGRSLSGSGTVTANNGVAVAFDGSGPGRLHRYSRLLYAGEAGDYLAAGCALDGVGEADWQRHVVRRRGEWTLVIDRVAVPREGEVLAERHWHMTGTIEPVADGLRCTKSLGGRARHLHLQTAGVLPEGQSGTSDRTEIVRASASPDRPLEFATLLHTTEDSAIPEEWLRLRALDAECVGHPREPGMVADKPGLGVMMLRGTEPGQWLEMPFTIDPETTGEVFLDLLGFTDRGTIRVLLDGREVLERFEHRAPGVVDQRVSLGELELSEGEHRLRLEVVEVGPDGKGFVGLGGLLIRPEGAPDAEVATGDRRVYALTRTTAGWRVDGPGRPSFVVSADRGIAVADGSGLPVFGARPGGLPESYAAALQAGPHSAAGMLPLAPECPTEPSPWRALEVGDAPVTAVARAEDGRIAAGDETGRVMAFNAAGGRLLSKQMESTILSLHFVGEDLLVGEDRGALTRLGPDAETIWQVVIPYEPMPWDYWSEYRSRVREITSADIGGDGVEEVLISNSDRRVYAFDADGRQLWRAPVEWGIFTAMTASEFLGEFGLYGGTSRPSIHGRCTVYGADGKVVKHITRPDLVSWSVPSQFRDMRLSDIDGDGEDEIVNAVDTNCRQLVVYEQDRSVKWDADVAGAANCIALNSEEDAQVIYCGSASGYAHAFDGSTGEHRWSTYIGEPVRLIARVDGRLAAVTRSRNVYLWRADGTLVSRVELPGPVSAVNRPGDHRIGDPLLLGTANGLVIADR